MPADKPSKSDARVYDWKPSTGPLVEDLKLSRVEFDGPVGGGYVACNLDRSEVYYRAQRMTFDAGGCGKASKGLSAREG
jgi:hypothetical protein